MKLKGKSAVGKINSNKIRKITKNKKMKNSNKKCVKKLLKFFYNYIQKRLNRAKKGKTKRKM